MKIIPVTLKGDNVQLEPLQIGHCESLCEFCLDEELWRWTVNLVKTRDDMLRYVETALEEQHNGMSLPFVTIERKSNKIVGSTRFGNIDTGNRKAEIGWTWIDSQWQQTFVNTEAKLLMLTHAFEVWRCIRVEFKTDALNVRSRNAILRVGAKEEGFLRNHMITDSGRFRNSVTFSIIDEEWESVKANLRSKLKKQE
ncbi:GNAT family protein [soil metagenome]